MKPHPHSAYRFDIFARQSAQRGSIILASLLLCFIAGITIAVSSTYLSSRIKQVKETAAKMDTRIVLDSTMAYTINGIKQLWCFSTSWTQDPNCDLNNSRNVERLFLSDESLLYIGQTSVPHPSPTISTRLSQISQTVDLGAVTKSHPLFLILSPLKDKYSTISFTLKREDSIVQTTKGREVPLRVTIDLVARPDSDAKNLTLSSKLYAFPREVSYFALLTPKDVYLGAPGKNPGDISFANVDLSQGGSGLRFESPVFVNDNLQLPAQGASMKNVTFVEKVILGGGMLYQNGKLYTPRAAGGSQSQYNSEIPEFAGILSGYDLDATRDEGLDYLFNLQPNDTLNDAELSLCRRRITATVDLTATKDSQLYTKLVSGASNSFSLSASLGNIDNLVEQKHTVPTDAYVIKTNVPGVVTAGTIVSRTNGSVFKVKFLYEGLANPTNPAVRDTYITEFFVSRDTEAVIYPLGNGSATNPQIKVKASPHVINGNKQFNQVDFNVDFVNAANLNMGPYLSGGAYKTGQITMLLEAFDYGYSAAQNMRSPESQNQYVAGYKVNGFTFYKPDPTNVAIYATAANTWYTNPMMSPDLANAPVPIGLSYSIYDNTQYPNDEDYVTFDQKCFAVPDDSESFYMSFGAADWTSSYLKKTRTAWSFNPEWASSGGYLDGDLIIDQGVARFDPAVGQYPTFLVKSLAKNCVITPTANFVTGLFGCEKLTIQARTTPLRIIGTVITSNIEIDPSAYINGIRWSNIYQPVAVTELLNARVLGRDENNAFIDCNNLKPLWMPNLGVDSVLKNYRCNPVSLRRADPFKWTTIDPDCGMDEDTGKVKCKKRSTRFMIKEVSRTGAL